MLGTLQLQPPGLWPSPPQIPITFGVCCLRPWGIGGPFLPPPKLRGELAAGFSPNPHPKDKLEQDSPFLTIIHPVMLCVTQFPNKKGETQLQQPFRPGLG